MRSLARLVASLALSMCWACSGTTNGPGRSDGSAGPCSPACGSGFHCLGGQCVREDAGPSPEDAGGKDSSVVDSGSPAPDGGQPSAPDGGKPGLADGGCAGTKSAGKKQPLDMYIMLDQSTSMNQSVTGGTSKWAAVTDALQAFLTQSNMDGISVGLQYFGLPSSGICNSVGQSCSDSSECGSCARCDRFGTCEDRNACDATTYAAADVEIAPVAQSGPAIQSSIQKHGPSTATPTSAALQGAIDHSRAWAKSHVQDVVVAVLATDGEPSQCDEDLSYIAAIAAQGVSGDPKILTFVIGVGDFLTDLNGIAAAGGTQSALMVDTASGNTAAQFLDALNRIRGQAIGCAYLIPDPPAGEILDYDEVNVQLSLGGASPIDFFRASDAADCGAKDNAWYYDNASAPHQIDLCPETCRRLEASASAAVEIVLGCQTRPN